MANIGTRFGDRYEILSPLGSGGMGVVYRARDLRLGRDVAIKILPEKLAQNSSALSRFEREAKALAALSHSNILAIHDFGTDNNISYAVMELLKGETLRSNLSSEKFSCKESLRVATAVADGLAAAHSQGIVHRDLKPENIFLTADGGVKILDFGLARVESTADSTENSSVPTATVTQQGALMGTVPYMSPEQVRGHLLDARTDIFSFGCVLFEMLSGTRAFSGNSSADVLASILKEDPPQLEKLTQGLPPQVAQTVSRCLRKNPDERFQSARDLAFALRMSADSSQAIPVAAAVLPRKKLIRRRIFLPILAVLIVSIAALANYYFLVSRNEIRSLAVLPFLNGSGDPNAEYLSDGITESLISSLSQVPQLRVMAHDTVFTYKDKRIDPRKVGQELNVEAIVTGKVIQHGNTLLIRANLVKVADGSEIWGDQYNRTMADILGMQTEISKEISGRLRARLTGEEQSRVTKNYTQDSEAYQLYLKGDYFFWKFTPEDTERSRQYFKKAIEKDPNYALAYAALADSYSATAFDGSTPPKESHEQGRKVAKRALELDNSLARGHIALAAVNWNYDWNWQAAEKEVQLALQLEPSRAENHRYYSLILRSMGRMNESIAEMKKARDLDPLSVVYATTTGVTYFWAGQYDQAIEQYRRALELDANRAAVHDSLSDVYAKKGLYKEAIAEEQRYLILSGNQDSAEALVSDFEKSGYEVAKRNLVRKTLDLYTQIAEEQYVSPLSFAFLYTGLDEKEKAFEWLEKAYEERSSWLVFLKTDPAFDRLRSDRRFSELVQKIGIP